MSNPIKIYVVTYTHKHGVDVSSFRTEGGALRAACNLAQERAEEWDDEKALAEYEQESDEQEKLKIFHDVECETSYGEVIEIVAVPLQD